MWQPAHTEERIKSSSFFQNHETLSHLLSGRGRGDQETAAPFIWKEGPRVEKKHLSLSTWLFLLSSPITSAVAISVSGTSSHSVILYRKLVHILNPAYHSQSITRAYVLSPKTPEPTSFSSFKSQNLRGMIYGLLTKAQKCDLTCPTHWLTARFQEDKLAGAT